jgi:hypothetical protein
MRRGVRKGAHLGISPPLMVWGEEAAAEEGAANGSSAATVSVLIYLWNPVFNPRRIHPSFSVARFECLLQLSHK